MKILICGDSFAVDWTKQYPNHRGWVNEFDATNLAQAGVSEYKILKQLQSVDLHQFDRIIVAHTSPFRVHVGSNPIHKNSVLHKDCDLIYSDLEHADVTHPVVDAGLKYYKHIFDMDYYTDVYGLIQEEIIKLTSNRKTIHITFFKDVNADKNFYNVFQKHRGVMNHLDDTGNIMVSDYIKQWLNY